MIKGIIFDLDDTLLKTRQTRYRALQYAAKSFYNLDLTDDLISHYWGRPFKEFMQKLFGNIDNPEKIIKNYESVLPQFPNQPYEDAHLVINTLSNKYLLGVLSSASRYLVNNDLISSGFKLTDFLYVQAEEDTNVHKPDPDVLKPILARFKQKGIEPKNIIYTGDTLGDFYAAKGAGLNFVGMVGRTASKEDFDKVYATTVKSLTELLNYIENL